MQAIQFTLHHEYIELNKLLKVTGVCDSGGEASALIVSGSVHVDGAVELRKARKIRTGQIIETDRARIVVLPGAKKTPVA